MLSIIHGLNSITPFLAFRFVAVFFVLDFLNIITADGAAGNWLAFIYIFIV